jgi:hypothetical protein
LTLESLKNRPTFFNWHGLVPDSIVAACTAVFRLAIDELIDAGPKPKRKTAMKILQKCIESLNVLDEKHNHFITTIECEDLCDVFYEIVHATGLRGCEDLADLWREF